MEFTVLYEIISLVRQKFELYSWRDGAEIIILSLLIYFFLQWLAKDTSKKPLLVCYSYMMLTIAASYAQLTILTIYLLCALPILIVTLIIVHQHTLQKNFIVHRTIKAHTSGSLDWLDELMSGCLAVVNKNHEVICIIERQDNLKELLTAPYYLNADIQKNSLGLILRGTHESGGMLWIHYAGKIVAAHVHVAQTPDSVWIDAEVSTLPLWKQDALFLTSKTDALVLYFDPKTKLCECIIAGKVVSELVAHHALMLIKRHLSSPSKQQESYDQPYTKTQQTSVSQ